MKTKAYHEFEIAKLRAAIEHHENALNKFPLTNKIGRYLSEPADGTRVFLSSGHSWEYVSVEHKAYLAFGMFFDSAESVENYQTFMTLKCKMMVWVERVNDRQVSIVLDNDCPVMTFLGKDSEFLAFDSEEQAEEFMEAFPSDEIKFVLKHLGY